MLFKAHRFRNMPDTYNVAAPILKTLTRDRDSMRLREIKADEEAESIYDEIHHEGTRFQLRGEDMQLMDAPKVLFYSDADALEDRVLFPEEYEGEENGFAVGAEMNKMEKLEYEAPDFNRFVNDLDTDEELSEGEERALEHTCEDEDMEDADEGSEWEDENGDDEEIQFSDESELDEAEREDTATVIEFFIRHPAPPKNKEEDVEDQFMRFLRRESSKGMVSGCTVLVRIILIIISIQGSMAQSRSRAIWTTTVYGHAKSSQKSGSLAQQEEGRGLHCCSCVPRHKSRHASSCHPRHA